MITLTDIAYVRSGVADLDAATRFATGIVGLELVDGRRSRRGAPARDARHHCLALVEGPSGVISSGFSVADADALDAGRDRARAVRHQRAPAARRRGQVQAGA